MDENNLFRAQEALGYHDRADGVVGRNAAGVSDDVRLAFVQPEYLVNI